LTVKTATEAADTGDQRYDCEDGRRHILYKWCKLLDSNLFIYL